MDNLTTLDALADPAVQAEQFGLYVQNRTGMFSSTPSTLAFLPLNKFIPGHVLESLKVELDNAISHDPKYNTPSYRKLRSWVNDGKVPHLELVLFPGTSFASGSIVTVSPRHVNQPLLALAPPRRQANDTTQSPCYSSTAGPEEAYVEPDHVSPLRLTCFTDTYYIVRFLRGTGG